jgi:hypothetical protein
VRGLATPLLGFLREEAPRLLVSGQPLVPDVEGLLTYLASPQPFLSTAENLENEATFLRVSKWLSETIFVAQRHALGQPRPEWATDLVRRWNSDRVSVISLNYDTLIESIVRTLLNTLHDPNGRSVEYFDLYPIPVLDARRRVVYRNRVDAPDAFQLIKLHGSLNLYYSGASSFFGQPIYDAGLVEGWPSDYRKTLEEAERHVKGLVPLVVPPTLSKAQYFENEMVRTLWVEARRALQTARRIFLLGYSLPNGDSQMRALLTTACEGTDITPVDLNNDVVARIQSLPGVGRIEVDHVGRPDVIETFARTWCGGG